VNVLVVNFGSSSLKFQIVDTDRQRMAEDQDLLLAKGQVDRIGGLALVQVSAGGTSVRRVLPIKTPRVALESVLDIVRELLHDTASGQAHAPHAALEHTPSASHLGGLRIDAVGHRVVHGGERFNRSVMIDGEVEQGIADCNELAPLHNPWNLKGIEAVRAIFGEDVPQVAVFDTAFHSTMSEEAFLYAIPYQLYRRHRIRRYGFHGTSHRYVAYRYRRLLGLQREDSHLISLHLGNGCSACAIEAGQSIDTSMGFTPLDGLVMGTRCGDLDPSIVEFLMQKEGYSLAEIDGLLNKQSGLLGLSGLTNDMRELLDEEAENADRRAHLAIEVFCRRVRKQIGAYLAIMKRCDALVFTGGIGAQSSQVRHRILSGLEGLGVVLETTSTPETLSGSLPGESLISATHSPRKVLVVPTNEELLIARDTVRCVNAATSSR
jgi:acetate kinase